MMQKNEERKISGLKALLNDFIPIYIKTQKEILYAFICITLIVILIIFFMESKKVELIVEFLIFTGLRIFPTTLSLSLATLSFMASGTRLQELEKSLPKDKKIHGFAPYKYALMVFTFFIVLNAFGLLTFWAIKIILLIFSTVYIQYIALFYCLFVQMLIFIYIFSIIASMYTLFHIQEKDTLV
ncbi:MAG: hypothetical protein ACRCR9_04415 [Chitinophagaceae bacterium]